jgi:hypothetical protein
MIFAPPLSNGEGPPSDEVETLLRAYFRAEMPHPWPAPPLARAPVSQPLPTSAVRGSFRSRLTLAASVAMLLAGTLAIPGRKPTGQAPPVLPAMSAGEATRVRLTETLIQPKDKPTELRIQVTEEVPRRK